MDSQPKQMKTFNSAKSLRRRKEDQLGRQRTYPFEGTTGSTSSMRPHGHRENSCSSGVHRPVLSITFRQSLARYLAIELGLAGYLDDDFLVPTARALRKGCVVCLDSIGKVGSEVEAYDLIIIEECVFVQYHFVAGAVTNKLPEVMRMFEQSKSHSPKGYRACCPAPHEGVDISQLWRTDVESLSDQLPDRSTVVFTTRAHHASLILSFLRKVAAERFGEDAASRKQDQGHLVGVQDDEWIRRFLAPPNAAVNEVDVLITTSVLQAGHSLDRYFRVSFDFLFCGVLSFREELQFTSRLRYLGRDDMAEYKFCWIPSGGADVRRAGQRRLMLDIEQTWDPGAGARWGNDFVYTVKSIWVPLKSELSGTFNRHFWLHKTECARRYTKEFTIGMSTSITRFLLNFDDGYVDDLTRLIDESVNLGDVAESHVMSVSRTLGDYVRNPRTKETTQHVLAAALTSDPCCQRSRHLRGNDGDDNRFWKRRKLSASRPAQQEYLPVVEYCLELLDSLGLVRVDAVGPSSPPAIYPYQKELSRLATATSHLSACSSGIFARRRQSHGSPVRLCQNGDQDFPPTGWTQGRTAQAQVRLDIVRRETCSADDGDRQVHHCTRQVRAFCRFV
ncbi:hypothetical protein V1515DRAFT_630449 [Lipomyces mesembrius]